MAKLIDLEKIKPMDFPSTEMDGLDVVRHLNTLPTVDAVPVDEIRVDFMRICLENQEAILNVSICGKPNEVKLPFSKDVAEVVHGRWIGGYYQQGGEWFYKKPVCSECGHEHDGATTYCENCGAKMDEETKFVGICEHCVYRDECDWPKLHPKTKLKECPDFKEGDNK